MLLRPGIRLQRGENQLVGGRLELKKFLLDHLSFLWFRSLHFGGGSEISHTHTHTHTPPEGQQKGELLQEPGKGEAREEGRDGRVVPWGCGHQDTCCRFYFSSRLAKI